MNWVRLWQDMPTDPKWRVVAKRSGRPLSEVLAVFVHMLTNAGANATERGVLERWCHDDIAAALDIEPEHVEAIYDAMQGKTLQGDALTGWEKRQPKREDGSAERAKAWRERNRTQANAEKRPDTETDTDTEREVSGRARERDTDAGGRASAELFGLNDPTGIIVASIARMQNNLAPDYKWARTCFENNVTLFGADAVRDGWAEFQADQADGKLRIPSIKALVSYFQTAKDRRSRDAHMQRKVARESYGRQQADKPAWAAAQDLKAAQTLQVFALLDKPEAAANA